MYIYGFLLSPHDQQIYVLDLRLLPLTDWAFWTVSIQNYSGATKFTEILRDSLDGGSARLKGIQNCSPKPKDEEPLERPAHR
jgi:hypothetical protein